MIPRIRMRGLVGEAAVVLCILAIFARSSIQTAFVPGSIELWPREVALGSMPEGEERVVRLVVANRGAEPADVVVVPSCTCMALDQGPLRLAPRRNAEIAVRVSTARKPGFNAAHVQIASPSGAVVAQSRITFTAVQPFVFEPPVLFLRAGDARVVTRASCLTRLPPDALAAIPSDPALTATVTRAGKRSFDVALALTGRPRARLVSVRVVATGPRGDETVGELAVTVPSTRIGDVRVASAAEGLPGDRARAWLLVDAESRCDLVVRSLRALAGETPSWRATSAATIAGTHVWVELEYPRSDASGAIEMTVAAGAVEERIQAVLPKVAGS